MNSGIKNMRILVTRPKPQGEELCERLRALGADPIYFPTIEIMPPSDVTVFTEGMKKLDEYDWIIFISPQAVSQSAPFMPVLKCAKVAAVGPGTAKALQKVGFPVNVYPLDEWSGEGLLKLPQFKNLTDQRIALLCGEDGRSELADTLRVRGAEVKNFIVYKRVLPAQTPLVELSKIDVIVCTSGDGLRNLVILCGASVLLQQIPLIVVSERIVKLAKELTFKKIFLAAGAGHDMIIEGIKRMSENQKENKKRAPFFWVNVGLFLSGLTLAMLILVVGFSGYRLLSLNKHFAELFVNLSDSVTQVQKNNADTQQEVRTELKNQMQTINEALQAQRGNKQDLRIAEAEYLVRIANDHLLFENDVPFAIRLLKSADEDIARTNDPALYTVREAVASDLADLQRVSIVDVAGIWLQLSQISGQLDKLPILNTLESKQVQPDIKTTDLSGWRRGLNAAWQELQKMIIIRKNDRSAPPFLAPNEQVLLIQNLHSELEKAEWALLHHQGEIYRASLQQAASWIRQYVNQDSSVTQYVLVGLTGLQQINVQPSVPALTNSLQAFQKYFSAAGR